MILRQKMKKMKKRKIDEVIMEIVIFNRAQIEELSANGFAPKTALLSITDAGWKFANLKSKPDYLLQLAFDDVDNDVFIDELGCYPTDSHDRITIEKKYNMLSNSQAEQISNFFFSVKDKAELFICQCEHGQSRSAAVATALLEYISKSGIMIFSNDDYYPNKMVFKRVYQYLNLNKKEKCE